MSPALDLFLIILILVIIIAAVVFFVFKPSFGFKKTKTVDDIAKNYSVDTLWKALNSQIVKLHELGQYTEATEIAEQALKTAQETLGSENPQVAITMNNLAAIYKGQRKFIEAESLYKQAINIWEKSSGKNSIEVASGLNNLGDLYSAIGKNTEAEAFYKQSITMFETVVGKKSPNFIIATENLIDLYKRTGNNSKAIILEEKLKQIKTSI